MSSIPAHHSQSDVLAGTELPQPAAAVAGAADTESAEAVAEPGAAVFEPSVSVLTPGSASLLRGLVREARPKQWIKNLLVLTAPLAAGTISHTRTLGPVAVAFLAFCLAASAVYYANDVLDVEADRAHPTKCRRPIAAGIVPIPLAWAGVAVLAAAAVAAAATQNAGLVALVLVYLAMHLSYSLWFKHVLVVDLALVAGGFLLRAMAGGVAAGINLSQWFLLTTAFGSLFMVAGKRYSELALMGEEAAVTRPSLAAYSASYLRFIWQTTAGLAILTYSLWAFDLDRAAHRVHWHEISIVAWSFLFLRYAMFVDAGKAGEPEDVVLGDRVIMAIGAAWLVLFAIGVSNAH